MVIDLTYKCSMGCTHCVSDCNKNGEEMSLQTLKDVCDFIKKQNLQNMKSLPVIVGISGGEIFEHSNILECLNTIFSELGDYNNFFFMLATNGRILSDTPEYLDYIKNLYKKYGKKKFIIQVTDDERFYPTKLTQKQRYNLEKLGAIIDSVPTDKEDKKQCLYPQGRALQNFNESWWNTYAPKCVNCRLIVKQNAGNTFKELLVNLIQINKTCTPSISPKGEIKIGESALCPSVANIYEPDNVIIEKIRNFNCQKCSIPINILKENNPIGYQLFNL